MQMHLSVIVVCILPVVLLEWINKVVCVAEPGQPACDIEELAEGGVHPITGAGG
jgi:hypothetical protein